MLEHANAIWHSGLRQDQSSVLQAVQKRAKRIIYGAISNKDACYFAGTSREVVTSDRQEHFYQNARQQEYFTSFILVKTMYFA